MVLSSEEKASSSSLPLPLPILFINLIAIQFQALKKKNFAIFKNVNSINIIKWSRLQNVICL